VPGSSVDHGFFLSIKQGVFLVVSLKHFLTEILIVILKYVTATLTYTFTNGVE